jgi:hypothetical protein
MRSACGVSFRSCGAASGVARNPLPCSARIVGISSRGAMAATHCFTVVKLRE